jgi:hypothetical protein
MSYYRYQPHHYYFFHRWYYYYRDTPLQYLLLRTA